MAQPQAEMHLPGVPLFRLYTLRFCYLVLAAGLGITLWPAVLQHTPELALRSGIKLSMLAGLGLTAALGLRYPVKMLPLLLFELAWKIIYLSAFALPLWRAQRLTAATMEDIFACSLVVFFLPLIPWRYVFREYMVRPGDRWR